MNTTDKKIKIEIINVCELTAYGKNARTHSDSQVAQIAASIREFGFTNPVLIDKEGGIIAGHGRVLGARKLGLKEVPCLRLDHLTENQKRAYIIADNKLALNAGWDAEVLQVELADLSGSSFNMDLLGFGVDDLAEAMGMGGNFEPGTEEDQGRLDQKKPVTCPNCGHEF